MSPCLTGLLGLDDTMSEPVLVDTRRPFYAAFNINLKKLNILITPTQDTERGDGRKGQIQGDEDGKHQEDPAVHKEDEPGGVLCGDATEVLHD